MGCSPGRVAGHARIVLDPTSALFEPGDILIAHSTDPAWAFLMATASALVVERGNLLSHAAIIGRELGIPCVIGIQGVMNILTDGQRIVVDGARGEVELDLTERSAATSSSLLSEEATVE
jgi:pyruvate,water dikinase